MDLFISATFLCLVLVLLHHYLKLKFNYWARRGVPFVPPEIPFGNLRGVGTRIANPELFQITYNYLKKSASPVGGIYFFTAPIALILDLELLKRVFVKDFANFQDRGLFVNERDDPLSAHLFAIEGEKWRNLRTKLTPTFTSGKMKMMHGTILSVAERFKVHLQKVTAEQSPEVELKELLAQFTTDVIGNTAFGIECDTMAHPESEFRRAGKLVVEFTPLENMKQLLLMAFPEACRKLRMRQFKPEVTRIIMKMLRETVRYREENKIKRNDFLSLLLQIKNEGKLEGESQELGKMSFNELAAQVFLFFIAGFETSSSTMTFAFYELAQNQDIQQRVREEVQEVLKRHGGEMTYEAACELHYLDQVINETLRKYPIVFSLFRKTANTYKVPDTNIILEKDTTVIIPVMGIHRDPEIYPEPDRFDPERFSKENVSKRHQCAFMPFGHGPRNCIGLRFGMMQTRLGIATVLSNFRVRTCSKTVIPMEFQPDSPLLSPKGGMYVKLEKL